MTPRSNKVFETTVIKALELSLDGDDFGAVSMMKEQGIHVRVIARVLSYKNQIRSTDSIRIVKHSK